LARVALCLARTIGYVEWYREISTRACVKFRDLGAADCTVCVGCPKIRDGELEDDGERCWGRSDCHCAIIAVCPDIFPVYVEVNYWSL